MRIAVKLPTYRRGPGTGFDSAGAVMEVAGFAEQAGFDALTVTDHPFPPTDWAAGDGHHPLDPFVALSFAAAATSRIRLQTGLLVLPYRHAFSVAKSVSSLDVLSGGRVVLGVAAGYLVDEFTALGVNYEARNDLMDEMIEAMDRAWTGRDVRWSAPFHQVPGNQMLPAPVQRPRPTLLVGGNSKLAIRRAVEFGDGWAPMGNPTQLAAVRRTAVIETVKDLSDLIGYARKHATSVNRTRPLEVSFTPVRNWLGDKLDHPAEALADIVEWHAIGVDQIVVDVPGDTVDDWTKECSAAARVLAPHLDERAAVQPSESA